MSCFQSVHTYPIRFRKSLSNSSKAYRLIRLANGVLVLLVSDPSSSVASCASCMCTGSHNDPHDILGLAHLCEHMLFLGSKPFPGPNQFLEFIDSNCGLSNAYTTGEQTVFYFELPVNDKLYDGSPVFNHALLMFSRFFKSPLFNENLIKNEICIIQGEHNNNVSDTKKILYHAFKILANKRHPFHRFSTGNVHTIRDVPKMRRVNVRNSLCKYFMHNYHSGRLTTVLKGPQSLNLLQKLAISNFGDIKEGPANADNFDHSMKMLEDQYLAKYDNQSLFTEGKMIYIRGASESTVRLFFPIAKASLIQHLTFFENCWCNIFGDESHGSLCDLLIQQHGYASSIFVFIQALTVNDRVLCMDMALTSRGSRNFDNLVYLTLNTVQKLLSELTDTLAKFLSQLLTISKLNFYFKNSVTTLCDEVSQLAETLQTNLFRLGPENIIKGDKDLDFADSEYPGDFCDATKDYWNGMALEFLQLSKTVLSCTLLSIVVVCSIPDYYAKFMRTNSISLSLPQDFTRDDYYNFEYKVVSLDTMRLIKQMARLAQSPPEVLYATQHPFLSQTQVELNRLMDYTDDINLHFQTKKFSSLKPPYLLSFDRTHETWFKQEYDLTFKSRVAISFHCQSLLLPNTPMSIIGVELICRMMGSKLRHHLYPAEMIGCSWAIYPNFNGVPSISININGLTKDISTIVALIGKEVRLFLETGIANTTYRDRARMRVQMRNSYLEMQKSHGITQLLALSQLVLEELVFSLLDRIAALELIDEKDLIEIGKHILNDICYARTFVSGDVGKHEAGHLASLLTTIVKDSSMVRHPPPLNEPSSYLFNRGRNYVLSTKNANKSDPLNTILYYMQFGIRDDPHARALGKLVSYVVSLSVRYELRNKRQLGYMVSSGVRYSRATMGMSIIILSGTFSGEQLLREIELYLFELELTISRYTEQDFKTKVVDEFLKSYDPSQAEDVTSNFLFAAQPIESSTNFDEGCEFLHSHKSYWESIVLKTYRFNSKGGNEEISGPIISKVSQTEFLQFFRSLVSIKSLNKASLAILVDSSMSETDIVNDSVKVQVKKYMEQNGIEYHEHDLHSILEKCQGDQRQLQKEVAKFLKSKALGLKYFMSSLKGFALQTTAKQVWDPDAGVRERHDMKRLGNRYGQHYNNTQVSIPRQEVLIEDIHGSNTIIGKLLNAPHLEVLHHYSDQQLESKEI